MTWVQVFILSTFRIDVSPLFLFLQQNLSDIILLFILTLFVDMRLQKSSILIRTDDVERVSDAIEGLYKNSSHADFVRYSLTKFYGDENCSLLTDIVITNKTVYRDAIVKIVVRDDPKNPHNYLYSQEIAFSCDSDRILLAVIPSATLQDQIFNVPEVDEVFCIPRLDQAGKPSLGSDRSITVQSITRNQHGRLEIEEIELKAVTKREERKLSASSGIDIGGAYFCTATARSTYDGKRYRFVVKYPEASFQRTTPFTYWITDRPIYIKQIPIDASGLTDSGPVLITVMPFLAATQTSKPILPRWNRRRCGS